MLIRNNFNSYFLLKDIILNVLSQYIMGCKKQDEMSLKGCKIKCNRLQYRFQHRFIAYFKFPLMTFEFDLFAFKPCISGILTRQASFFILKLQKNHIQNLCCSMKLLLKSKLRWFILLDIRSRISCIEIRLPLSHHHSYMAKLQEGFIHLKC